MVGNLHELGYRLNDSGQIGDLTTLQHFFLFQVEEVRQEEMDEKYDTDDSPDPGGANTRSDSPNTREMQQGVRDKVRQKDLNQDL